jgi:hypothetical protein
MGIREDSHGIYTLATVQSTHVARANAHFPLESFLLDGFFAESFGLA